jgi:hypothetical protein
MFTALLLISLALNVLAYLTAGQETRARWRKWLVWMGRVWFLRRFKLLALCVLVALVGCALGCTAGPRLAYLPDVPQPPPEANLPVDMRLKNWVGTDADGDRGGSCVHASTRHDFRAAGEWELDELWFKNSFEGPEYAIRLLEKLDSIGVKFAATEDGDIELLEAASRDGRWATIFYYPSHSVNFCGFDEINGNEVAILLDNNFPNDYIVVEKNLFIESWRHAYGGFAVVPWITQIVPRTFPRSYETR